MCEEMQKTNEMGGRIIKGVTQYCYLGDILNSDGMKERAVKGRVATKWCTQQKIPELFY